MALGPRSEIPRPRDRPGSRGPQRLWRADAVPCILPQSNRPARGRPRDALPSSLRDSSTASTTSFRLIAKRWTPPSRQDPCLLHKPGQTPCHLDRLSGTHGDPTPLGPAWSFLTYSLRIRESHDGLAEVQEAADLLRVPASRLCSSTSLAARTAAATPACSVRFNWRCGFNAVAEAGMAQRTARASPSPNLDQCSTHTYDRRDRRDR